MVGEAILSLDSLRCSLHASAIETELRKRKGVIGVELNDVTGTVRVVFDPALITAKIIRDCLNALCYSKDEGEEKAARLRRTT